MPSRLNQLVIGELKKRFAGVDTCFFVDFTGLAGRKAADLRHQLHSACGEGASFTVVKTSLARRAFAELDSFSELAGDILAACLDGPTAVAFGADDPVLLARTLADWGKQEARLRFKGGMLAGRPLPAETVAALAMIPPKPILMGQVVGTIAAPLTALVGVTQGILRQLVGVVDAWAKKKAEDPSDGKEN